MVSSGEVLGLTVIVFGNTVVAALLTRFLRVRLKTRWGSAAYIAFLVPIALLVSTLLFGSIFGPNLGSAAAVVGVTVLLPLALGVSFDYFWMPAPEEVDLPERSGGRTGN
ncbi:MAG: hypothetical protein V5A39_07575 [Haloarculaceae archaeon]